MIDMTRLRSALVALKASVARATSDPTQWEHFDGCTDWSDADDEAACEEGWSIWQCHGSDNGPYQLQRCDEMALFPNDAEAWRHVWKRADAGSDLHRRALAFLEQNNPLEWKHIADAMGNPS